MFKTKKAEQFIQKAKAFSRLSATEREKAVVEAKGEKHAICSFERFSNHVLEEEMDKIKRTQENYESKENPKRFKQAEFKPKTTSRVRKDDLLVWKRYRI